MSIEVRLPTLLRPAAGGRARVEAKGATVGQVLDSVVAEYPELGAQVLAGEGGLHRFVNVYLNDDDVRYLDRLDTKVGEDDVVSDPSCRRRW